MANSYSYYRALSLVEDSIVASLPVFDDTDVEFSESHQQFMQKLFNKMKGGKYKSSVRTVVKVIVAAAVILSLTTTVIGFPRTKEFTVTDYGIYSEYSVTEDSKDYPVKEIHVGYIPEGFEITNKTNLMFYISNEYAKDDEIIQITKMNIKYSLNFDSENCTVETESTDGLKYICSYRDGLSIFVWNDGKYIYCVKTTIDKNEAFKIARHLK